MTETILYRIDLEGCPRVMYFLDIIEGAEYEWAEILGGKITEAVAREIATKAFERTRRTM